MLLVFTKERELYCKRFLGNAHYVVDVVSAVGLNKQYTMKCVKKRNKGSVF